MTAPDMTLLVMNVLRLKGFAECDAVARCAGIEVSMAQQVLEKLAADELVSHREGRVSGWSLSASGRSDHAARVANELEHLGCRAAIDAAYQRFLELNVDLLALCTDWQLRTDKGEQVLNDHSDPDYDASVISRLSGLDDAVQPVCESATKSLARFGTYGPRLGAARRKLEEGDHDWFTKPLIDSYHTVWFEMHEDLLATLGIERSAEGSA